MLVSSADMELESSPGNAREALDIASRMVQRCKAESRASIENLHSITLERVGLKQAIEEQVRPLAEMDGAVFSMEVTGEKRRLPVRIETALLRIAHEAGANAGKHAKAKSINLTIDYDAEQVRLTVQDDGRGFDPDSKEDERQRSFGLLTMEERALKLNGNFSIESAPGSGTSVTATLPLS